jgi:hypothetical protein
VTITIGRDDDDVLPLELIDPLPPVRPEFVDSEIKVRNQHDETQ